MPAAFGDDTTRQLADDVLQALVDYADRFGEVVQIAAGGASGDEIATLATDCFESAFDLRFVETDEIGFASSAPAAPSVLIRELYESFVVLSGLQRVADTLSLPVATCANGNTLASLTDPKGELAAWYRSATGSPFEPPTIPRSLVRTDRRRSAYLGSPRTRLAANSDRERDEGAGQENLTRVFARRLNEAVAEYEDAVRLAESGASDLNGELTRVARRFGPVLLGFARVADRGQGGLQAPEQAQVLARALVDGFVTLTAVEAGESADALDHPSVWDVQDAASPIAAWLAGG
jgi:hypothetical protein